mmetsp:Transcript_40540/g.65741  ORF Transcript_40540/g.65741 Transcript_40540/m.65741 type:complete len:85 (+) Transcript_40540:341-595(+)
MVGRLSIQDEDETVRNTFRAFDLRHRGFIKLEDFRQILNELSIALPEETTLSVFREADTDNDGRVGYQEFSKLMAHRYLVNGKQ